MSVSISGSQITFNDASTQNTAATGFGFKNRIINGAMQIDQRNAGAAVTATDKYPVDRWHFYKDTAAAGLSLQQSTTVPAGFKNSISVTVTASATPASGEGNTIVQVIEGFNCADLNWGTASALTVTVSFWTRSSLTGTFGGAVRNSAGTRSYPFTYTINSANTWEYKTVTIPGETSGTWATDNTAGIQLWFGIGVGSGLSGTAGSWGSANYISATGATNIVGTNGATFYITGVQLEKGSTATSFDYRPYGTELALCQRYYNKWAINSDGGGYTSFGSGYVSSSTNANINISYPVQMRATPTFAQSTCAILEAGGAFALTGLGTSYAGQESAMIGCTVASGLTAGRGVNLCANNNVAGNFTASAEL